MKIHFQIALKAIPIGLSLFTFVATTASADPIVDEAASADFNAAVEAVNSSSSNNNCAGAAVLPDAPKPNVPVAKNQSSARASSPAPLSTKAKILSKINFLTSAGLAEDPTSPGPLTLKGGSFGVTYGDVQISQLLAKSGIPNTPDTKVYVNVNVTSAPLTAKIAKTAGDSAIQQIEQQEAGLSWEQGDLNSVKGRVKYLEKDAYLQKLTVSVAILTKDGKLYTCEAGKEPEVFLRANDPNGSTNPIELATGGSSDALRVGSSYSTSVVGCTAAKSLGKDSKLQLGLQTYRDTRPFKNENVTFGNEIFANQKSFNADSIGVPNAARADAVLNQKVNDNVKISIAGTAGVALDKPVYSVNTTLTTGRNSLFADKSQAYYGGMVSNDPNDSSAAGKPQKQTGELLADSLRVYRKYSVFGDAEWNKGVPDAAQATTADGVVNFNIKKFGAQYEKDMKWSGNDGRARLIVGGDIQKTNSTDGSWTGKDTTYNAFLKISASGKVMSTAGKLLHKKKRKSDDSVDVAPAPAVGPQVVTPSAARQ